MDIGKSVRVVTKRNAVELPSLQSYVAGTIEMVGSKVKPVLKRATKYLRPPFGGTC